MTFYMDVTARHNGMNMGDRGPTPQAALDSDLAYYRKVASKTECPECRAPIGQNCRAAGMTTIAPWVHPRRILQYQTQEAA